MISVFLTICIFRWGILSYPMIVNPIENQAAEVRVFFDQSIPLSTFNGSDETSLIVSIGDNLPEWVTNTKADANITSHIFKGNGSTVYAKGTRGYVTQGKDGFSTFDVSDKYNPVQTNSFQTLGYANGILVDGQNAYVTISGFGIQIVRSINTDSPFERSKLAFPGEPKGIKRVDDFLFIANQGLTIVDVRAVDTPLLHSHFPTNGNSSNLVIEEEYLYLCDGFNGLAIFNISNITSNSTYGNTEPSLISYINKNPENATDPRFTKDVFVSVDGDHAYVIDDKNLKIFNIENKTLPVLVGTFDPDSTGNSIFAETNLTFFLDGNVFKIIDSSDFGNMKVMGMMNSSGILHSRMVMNGNFFYIATDVGLDVGSFGNLEVSGKPQSKDCGSYNIDVIGTHDGISIIDTFVIKVSGYKSGYFDDECKIFECFDVWNNDSSTCNFHGNCTEGQNEWFLWNGNCHCFENYFGLECNITTCSGIWGNSSKVCSSHGDCIAYEYCDCNDNYYGEDCDVTTCFGDWNNRSGVCYDHGDCFVMDECQCHDNYYGKYCNITTCNYIWSNETLSNTTAPMCSGYGSCIGFNLCNCIDGKVNDGQGRCVPALYSSGERKFLSVGFFLFLFFFIF